MAECQSAEVRSSAGEERVGADHKSASSQLNQGCEHLIEVECSRGMHDRRVNPETAGRGLRVFRGGLRKGGAGRIDEEGQCGLRWRQLVQKFQSLRPYFQARRDYTR